MDALPGYLDVACSEQPSTLLDLRLEPPGRRRRAWTGSLAGRGWARGDGTVADPDRHGQTSASGIGSCLGPPALPPGCPSAQESAPSQAVPLGRPSLAGACPLTADSRTRAGSPLWTTSSTDNPE